MRFTIVGAGALGSILAAHLQQAGNEVTLLARGKRARDVQARGLVLNGLRDMQVSVPLLSDPANISSTDVLILCVKTYQHSEVLQSLQHLQLKNTFSVANGVHKTEQLASCFGEQYTSGCMADLSGELLVGGEVLFTRNVMLQLGALSTEYAASSMEVATVINDAGIHCQTVADIRSIEWSKFVPWVAFLALSVLTRLPSCKIMLDADAARIMYYITREMYELARQLHIELQDQSPAPAVSIACASEEAAIAIIREIGMQMQENAPEHRMSALQDLQNRRVLEVEETLGDALSKARQLNISMPTLEKCYYLVSAINRNISDTV